MPLLKKKMLNACNEKITKKGSHVGLSFYAFSANKNDDPEILMSVAEWWIRTHQLNHFKQAIKIKQRIEAKQ